MSDANPYSAAPTRYREYPPSEPLRAFVVCYWTLCTGVSAGAQRVLPDGCMDILFSFAAPARPAASNAIDEGVHVIGVMTRPVVTALDPGTEFLGVRFRPGEAFSFFGVAAHEWKDHSLRLGDAWGPFARELEERLAPLSMAERVRALDRALCARLTSLRPADLRLRRAVTRTVVARGRVTVRALSLEIGIGERQLERAFRERVGLAPKLFARVVRLQALVAALRQAAAPPFAALAHKIGFVDQAHLIRDLRMLAGTTPSALRAELDVSGFSNPPQQARAKKRS